MTDSPRLQCGELHRFAAENYPFESLTHKAVSLEARTLLHMISPAFLQGISSLFSPAGVPRPRGDGEQWIGRKARVHTNRTYHDRGRFLVIASIR